MMDRVKYGVIQGETEENVIKTSSDELIEDVNVPAPELTDEDEDEDKDTPSNE